MSLFNQMKQTKDKVRLLLEQLPKLRDDDYKLIATYYVNELGGEHKVKQMNGFDLLAMLAEGKLTHPETIRRNRADLQKNDPSLRGKNYEKRQEEGVQMSVLMSA